MSGRLFVGKQSGNTKAQENKKFMPSPLQKSETVFAWRRFIFLLGILTANIIKKEDVFMNTLVIVLIAVVVLGLGYVLYGRRIAKNGVLTLKPKLLP